MKNDFILYRPVGHRGGCFSFFSVGNVFSYLPDTKRVYFITSVRWFDMK